MRRSFDIPIRITANKPWNVLCSPATPRYTPMGWFNYLHSWVLLWKKMCWFNQDTAVISKRDQKGMLNGRVHISFLDFPEDADIVTGSSFLFFFFNCMKIPGRESRQIWQTWGAVGFFPFYNTHSTHLSRYSSMNYFNSLLSKLLACAGIVNWPVFSWRVLRGSPGPSMGWSARNIRAWSKVLTTKCSRSFSSDRSVWKTRQQKHKDWRPHFLYVRMQSKSGDPDQRIYSLLNRTSCICRYCMCTFSSSCLLTYAGLLNSKWT